MANGSSILNDFNAFLLERRPASVKVFADDIARLQHARRCAYRAFACGDGRNTLLDQVRGRIVGPSGRRRDVGSREMVTRTDRCKKREVIRGCDLQEFPPGKGFCRSRSGADWMSPFAMSPCCQSREHGAQPRKNRAFARIKRDGLALRKRPKLSILSLSSSPVA